MLTWWVVLGLVIGVSAQRLVGMLALDPKRLGPSTQAVLAHIPLAVVSTVIALQTFSRNGSLTLDARVFGVGAAMVCVSRRLPMFVTVMTAAGITALARAIT